MSSDSQRRLSGPPDAENSVVAGSEADAGRWHRVEKDFYELGDDVEAVCINYVCTPLGGSPDWEHQRGTRYMPRIEPRLRRKVLRLPLRILDPERGKMTDRYLLYYYFEIVQNGYRNYSPHYVQEIFTAAGAERVRGQAQAAAPSVKEAA